MAPPTDCPKIKPYTVIDLSTQTVLSEEEINNVLNQVSQKEYLKSIGEYAVNGNHAKVNGDPPNFLLLPPKKRSKSLNSLFETHQELKEIDDPTTIWKNEENADNSNDYCQLQFRGRSNTAPTGYQEIVKNNIAATRMKKLGKVSRFTSPSSPGVAKRKVQQKLQQQRDAKQQQQQQQHLTSNSYNFIRQTGVPSKMSQKQSGLRMPSSRIPSSNTTNAVEPPRSQSALREPEAFGKSNRITQANQRSTLPRPSNKKSDTKTLPNTNDDAAKNTQSLIASKSSISSTANTTSNTTFGLQQPKTIGKPPKYSSLSTRNAPPAGGGEKRSLESLRMNRERSTDNLRVNSEKNTDNLIIPGREKSSDNFRKISSSSVPCPRTKQSFENLSRESTAENLRGTKNESSSSIGSQQSSISSSYSSDSIEYSKSTGQLSSLKKPQVPVATKSLSSLKKPSTGITPPKKLSGLCAANTEPKISKLPSSGISKPSVITKPSGIMKGSIGGMIQKPCTPTNQALKKTTETPSVVNEVRELSITHLASPVSARKHKVLLDSLNRRASDGIVTMKTKTKLDVIQQKKKISDVYHSNTDGTKIPDAHDERNGLKHPTVGKISNKIESSSNSSKLKRPLQFKSNNNNNNNILRKPSFQKISTANSSVQQHPQKLQQQSLQQQSQKQQQQSLQQQSQQQQQQSLQQQSQKQQQQSLQQQSQQQQQQQSLQQQSQQQQQQQQKHQQDTIMINQTSDDQHEHVNNNSKIQQLIERKPSAAEAEAEDANRNHARANSSEDDHDPIRVDSTDPFSALDRNNTKNINYASASSPLSATTDDDDDDEETSMIGDNPTCGTDVTQSKKISDQNNMPSNGVADIQNDDVSIRNDLGVLDVNKNILEDVGYAEPDDCGKRSDLLSSDSGYIEPLDVLSSSPINNSVQLRTQFSNNSSGCPDESCSSNESNPSPRFGENATSFYNNNKDERSKRVQHDDRRSNTSSQMKRNQPIIVIPPPQLDSYDDNDLLAPVPKEYMRTPSSDIEEFQIITHNPIDMELRRKARQQAIRVWKNKNIPQEEYEDQDDPDGIDNEEIMLDENGEFLDADVFYPSHPFEHATDTLERYAARTSIRRSSVDDQHSMEENIRQLETIALDRKGKKTSKLKKFFKKLSSKKDSASKGDNDSFTYHPEQRQKTDDAEIIQMSASSNYNLKTRRRSDGTISVFSVNDITTNNNNNIYTPVTPLTKRRLFAINLSFMKRGKRQRSNTSVINTSDATSTRPSETVRALCSPEMARKKNNFTSIATSGRRASDPSIYRVHHSSTSTSISSRIHHNTTPTSIKIPLTKKYRAPMPPTSSSPPVTFTLQPTSLTTLTTTVSSETTTTNTPSFYSSNNLYKRHMFPRSTHGSASSDDADYINYPITQQNRVNTKRLVFPPPSQNSASSDNEEADYINYPFSKANVKPPQKPSRNGSKGSCGEAPPPSGHRRSSSIGVTGKNSKVKRHSSVTSDDSMMSSESLGSSHTNGDVFYQNSVKTRISTSSSNGSLRRTPLRHSVDSYNKLLEVHRQTIDKIAFEVSRLVCTCEQLQDASWNDFDRQSEAVQLGTEFYMVLPVSSKKVEQKSYTAWLRLDQQHTSSTDQNPTIVNYPSTTLHRNCLHICHSIEPTYATPFEESLPKSIEVNTAFISSQFPKMTLARYVALTLEKHTRYAEVYERETALILLQVVKGVLHLLRKRVPLKSISTENVFILNTGDPSVVLSPRKQPNKCPAVIVAYLPGLGDSCKSNGATDNVTNVCHQLAFLLYELLHLPYEEELRLIINSPMLFTTLPDLTIKSIYSRYLQTIIDKLLGSTTHTLNSLDELILTLEVFLFGPTNISDHSEREGVSLIQKWHNRRCVDMVTHILKEAPLIMLCASEHQGQEVERIKSVDQEILLECEFLSTVNPTDIFKISKELQR